MLEFAEHVDLADVDAPLVDTCGTGGDGRRHGQRVDDGRDRRRRRRAHASRSTGAGRASSKCGSADVLEALGVVIDLGPDGVARCVRRSRASASASRQRFHPAMRFAAPVRRELGTPTTFNFLGPLANPAGASRRTVGVSDPAMAERVVAHAARRSASSARSCSSATTASTSSPSPPRRPSTSSSTATCAVSTSTRRRRDPHGPSSARSPGGDAAGNAQVVHQVFAGGDGPDPRHRRPQRRGGPGRGRRRRPISAAGVELARAVIDDGRAAATLDAFVRVSVAARESGVG